MAAKLKAKWQRVTNAYIIEKFKQPECTNCQGTGEIKEGRQLPIICGCTMLAFRRAGDELVRTNKLRYVSQRVGNRDVGHFEYRELGSV